MIPPSVGTPLLWIGFTLFVLVALVLDLGLFHRHAHKVSIREAMGWSVVWIGLALLFNLGVTHWFGRQSGLEFLTGYLIELALSVDNLFVFLVIFSYFAVPPHLRHRVLFWGILGAMIMRIAFILAGVALLAAFSLDRVRLRRLPRLHGVQDPLPEGDRGPSRQELHAEAGPPVRPGQQGVPRHPLPHPAGRKALRHPAPPGPPGRGDHRRGLRRGFHPRHLRDHPRSVHRLSPPTSSPSWACAPSSSCWPG